MLIVCLHTRMSQLIFVFHRYLSGMLSDAERLQRARAIAEASLARLMADLTNSYGSVHAPTAPTAPIRVQPPNPVCEYNARECTKPGCKWLSRALPRQNGDYDVQHLWHGNHAGSHPQTVEVCNIQRQTGGRCENPDCKYNHIRYGDYIHPDAYRAMKKMQKHIRRLERERQHERGRGRDYERTRDRQRKRSRSPRRDRGRNQRGRSRSRTPKRR